MVLFCSTISFRDLGPGSNNRPPLSHLKKENAAAPINKSGSPMRKDWIIETVAQEDNRVSSLGRMMMLMTNVAGAAGIEIPADRRDDREDVQNKNLEVGH